MRAFFVVAAALLLGGSSALADRPNQGMIEVSVDGRRVEGAPLAWSNRNITLLGRDGRLLDFRPQEAREYRRTATTFRGYPATVVRDQLIREFGPDYKVVGTGHYLVAHPHGKGSEWSRRFEDLYRSFIHYFSVRGFQLKEPEFPLVAIVFENRQDFMRYAASEGASLGANVVGYYLNASNRVALYDSSNGAGGEEAWSRDASTIIHEATHQTAFNTGIHTRLAPQPQWVVEGLATMFEAPGVWNSRNNRRDTDRVNRGRLEDFKRYAKTSRPAGSLPQFIASDQIFRADPLAAYAEAWALTYYLVETQPRKFSEYLRRVAGQTDFEHYGEQARLDDFTAVFGDNWRFIEARFLRHMEQVR